MTKILLPLAVLLSSIPALAQLPNLGGQTPPQVQADPNAKPDADAHAKAAADAAAKAATAQLRAHLRAQLAGIHLSPELAKDFQIEADKAGDDSNKLNVLIALAAGAQRYGVVLTPFAYYKRKLADQQPRVAALGDDAYRLDPQRANFIAMINGPFDLHLMFSTYETEYQLACSNLDMAKGDAARTASLKAAFRAVAAPVLLKISAVKGVATPTRDAFKAREAALAAKENCGGKCDAAWTAALQLATTRLGALQEEFFIVVEQTSDLQAEVERLAIDIKDPMIKAADRASFLAEQKSILNSFTVETLAELKPRLAALQKAVNAAEQGKK